MNQEHESIVTQAISWIEESRRVVVFTGAGMSTESGLPTFRGQDGLWQGYHPQQLATAEAFERSPEVVRSWYRWRRDLVEKAQPHPGHLALANWCLHSNQNSCVITQNVDGLHQRSGCPDVIELHGSILHDRCHRCGHTSTDLDVITCRCGGGFRPAVVWFGERMPEPEMIRSQQVIDSCELLIVIGTSAVVHPAAGLIFRALDMGASVIEVNPAPVLPAPVVRILGTAIDVLPRIFRICSMEEDAGGPVAGANPDEEEGVQ